MAQRGSGRGPDGTDADASESAALIVGRLADRLDDVTAAIQRYLMSEIAELRGNVELRDLLRDSVEQNVDTVFAAIKHNIPIEHVKPPASALEYARRLAQHGVSANALLRAYRLGQQTLLGIVHDEVRVLHLDAQQTLDVFQEITATTFHYIDQISEQVTAAYQVERDRWLATQNTARALRIRELLDQESVDVDAVSNDIGYPLRRLHLAAVVSYADPSRGDELVRMERFARALAESVGSQGAPLFVAADRLTGWVWIPLAANAAPHAVAQVRRFVATRTAAQQQPPALALGDPLPGVDGFRRSHRQALAVRAVGIAAGANAQRIVTNDDPGLSVAALLTDNLPAAREWVGDVLGALASDSDVDERLRETLRVFLRTGSSYKAAATELTMHFNTVRYRVQRAEERRGRPITTDRLDVEIALLLCHWFGGAVLH